MKKTISILWITSILLSWCTWKNTIIQPDSSAQNTTESSTENTNENKVSEPEVKIEENNWISKIKIIPENEKFEKVNELKKETIIEWTWDEAKSWDSVSVHYYWRFIDWSKFDSSIDRWQTFWFTLWAWMVIKWWDEWVTWMKVWEVRRIHVPSSLWYWENTYWPIPWWSTLIFDVELVWINK